MDLVNLGLDVIKVGLILGLLIHFYTFMTHTTLTKDKRGFNIIIYRHVPLYIIHNIFYLSCLTTEATSSFALRKLTVCSYKETVQTKHHLRFPSSFSSLGIFYQVDSSLHHQL